MFRKFSSIEKFNNIIKQARKDNVEKLVFTGTVKIHGTNACIGYVKSTNTVFAQSRERILDLENDNFGFSNWVEANKLKISNALKKFDSEYVYLYGEWFGKGVQKHVGVASLSDKYFASFSLVTVDNGLETEYMGISLNLPNTICVQDAGVYFLDVNVMKAHLASEEIERLTLEVEADCPVASFLGVRGIGEGIVWRAGPYIFKSKGTKHSSSKVVGMPHAISPAEAERLESVEEFAIWACNQSRMQQALEEVGNSLENIKQFLNWVIKDILKESALQLEANNLTSKDITKACYARSRKWFLENHGI